MKVADIRPDALMAGQQAAMLRDIATLLDRRAEFVAVPCPACGRDAPTVLYEKYGMTHNRCAACRTQYISPRPSSAVLRDFYEASENYAYFAAHIFPASAETRRSASSAHAPERSPISPARRGSSGRRWSKSARATASSARKWPRRALSAGSSESSRRPTSPESAGQKASRSSRSEEHTSELPSLIRKSYAAFCLNNTIIPFI